MERTRGFADSPIYPPFIFGVGRCELDAFNGTLTSSGGCEFREEEGYSVSSLLTHRHSSLSTSLSKAGWAFPPYTISPLGAIQHYVRSAGPDININLENFNTTGAIAQAAASEVAIVFANAYATENQDRQNLTLWANGDNLIKDVAAVNNNTIVIIHAPGPVLVEEWIEHENITAVLFAYLPGQEGGNSLPGVLFGEKSPSGKVSIHSISLCTHPVTSLTFLFSHSNSYLSPWESNSPTGRQTESYLMQSWNLKPTSTRSF